MSICKYLQKEIKIFSRNQKVYLLLMMAVKGDNPALLKFHNFIHFP